MQYDGSIRIDTIKIVKILAALINTESIKKSMEMLNTVMKDIYLDLSPTLEQYNFEEALKSIRYSFAEMADAIGLKGKTV